MEEKKVGEDEMVLDGGLVILNSKTSDGFDVSDVNFMGHGFRDYETLANQRQKGVQEFYKVQHIHQTYDFKMREEYKKLDKMEMSVWECCELLNNVVDDSDSDLDEPQIQHLFQSAEVYIRKDYPDED